MFGFGIRMIFVLIVLSGAIAYMGDLLGRAIGKRRLTLFGLRPKHTAIAITIVSGILIALLTVSALITISKDARTALFGLDELRTTLKNSKTDLMQTKTELEIKSKEREALVKETEKISNELVSSKNEIARLQEIRNKLAKEVETTREGKLLFKVGDPIIVENNYKK